MTARVLGARYRLGGLLGRGGMAEVFDGYDERLDRPVAVKLLRPEMAADPGIRDRFEVEARSAARLSHPNVVAVFDTGEEQDGTPYLVMERLPGVTLADRMEPGPVDELWLRKVAGDVLAALGAAHAAGIVHRDVKPGNILLAEDGCAKVADFGIAKSLEMTGDLTGTGLLVGTPAYVAPERLEGRPATERSDLYALGVVLYEALAGTKPFEAGTPVALANAVLHDVPRPLRELRPDVDPGFAAAIEQAMAKEPAARPASAHEMARLLAGRPAAPDATVAVGVGAPAPTADATLVDAPRVVPPPGRVRTAARLSSGAGVPRLALVAGAALLVVLLLLGLSARGGSSGDSSLAAAIRDLAGRVEEGDGAMGPEASRRLEVVADRVEAGGGADAANELLRDAAAWRAEGRLSGPATTEMIAVLSRIEGVDPALATTTTLPPTTTTTAAPLVEAPVVESPGDEGTAEGGDGDEGGEGGDKKKGKGRDD